MAYFLAESLDRLRDEVDTLWPNRSRRSDGWIGDPSHQARESDHNPDYADNGVVRALDITASGIDVDLLLKHTTNDARVAYVIYNEHIYTHSRGWTPYKGPNPHTAHVHISIRHTLSAQTQVFPWFGGVTVQTAKATGMATYSSPVPKGCRFTSGFGPRWGSVHMGSDWAPPTPGQRGVPVHAVADGTVIAVGTGYGRKTDRIPYHSGKYVLIDHGSHGGDRMYSYSGHLDSYNVKVGDKVKAGEIIGDMGDTGNVTGVHLHLGVAQNTSKPVYEAKNYGDPGWIDAKAWLESKGIKVGSDHPVTPSKTAVKTSASKSPSPTYEVKRVTTHDAKIYDRRGDKKKVVGTPSKGYGLNVVKVAGSWTQVRWNFGTSSKPDYGNAWIASSDLAKKTDAQVRAKVASATKATKAKGDPNDYKYRSEKSVRYVTMRATGEGDDHSTPHLIGLYQIAQVAPYPLVHDQIWGAKTDAHYRWVHRLQAEMNKWKGDKLKLDGSYGLVTDDRVLDLQLRNEGGAYKGYPDGVAGPVFCKMLGIPNYPN